MRWKTPRSENVILWCIAPLDRKCSFTALLKPTAHSYAAVAENDYKGISSSTWFLLCDLTLLPLRGGDDVPFPWIWVASWPEWKWHYLTSEARSWNVIHLPPGSLGTLTLGTQLPCREEAQTACGHEETPIPRSWLSRNLPAMWTNSHLELITDDHMTVSVRDVSEQWKQDE